MPGVGLLKCFSQLWLNTNFNPSSRQIYQNCVCLIPHDRRCLELGLSESKVNVWTFSCRSFYRPPANSSVQSNIYCGSLRRRLTSAGTVFLSRHCGVWILKRLVSCTSSRINCLGEMWARVRRPPESFLISHAPTRVINPHFPATTA